MTEPQEEYYTSEQVGKMLQLAPESVVRLARQGKIPAVKVGGSWRFNKEEIARFLETQRNAYFNQQNKES
jgi:excisionase family DNA binding protein